MSKPIKQLLVSEYTNRIKGADQAMLIGIRGVKAIPTSKLRRGLASKKIKITVLSNALARKAMTGTALEPLNKFLTGSSALAYGGQSVVEVAREVVKLIEKMPEVELKGAILDGQLFEGKAGVTALSKFPTREEAQADVVTLIVSPGKKLLAQLKGPGATIAGIIKSIEEKLEKGETIAKAG